MDMKNFTITADNAATIVNILAYEDYARLKRRYVECDKSFEMDMLPRGNADTNLLQICLTIMKPTARLAMRKLSSIRMLNNLCEW